jgi:hypothetical protein
MTSSMQVFHSVLAASQKFSAQKGASQEPCPHYGKIGHTPGNCFLHSPEKLPEYHACQAAGTTRDRGTASTPRGSMSVVTASPENKLIKNPAEIVCYIVLICATGEVCTQRKSKRCGGRCQ